MEKSKTKINNQNKEGQLDISKITHNNSCMNILQALQIEYMIAYLIVLKT